MTRVATFLGAALIAAAVTNVMVDGTSGVTSDYETGRLLGTAARNVALGLAAAALVSLVLRRLLGQRWYWRVYEGPPLLAAGAIALALAFVTGAPETSEQEGATAARDCREREADPTTVLPSNDVVELSEDEMAATLGDPPDEHLLERLALYWVRSRQSLPVLVGVQAVGASSRGHALALAGFTDSLTEQGATPREVAIAGATATEFRTPGEPQAAIQVRIGCYAVTVIGEQPKGVRALAATLLRKH